MTLHDIDADVAALHQADDVESLERRLLELACARTGTRNGAIFLWDGKHKGLAVHFHVVDDVVVTLPGTGSVLRKRTDGRPNGIAFACFGSGRRYVANDTSKDPSYAPYFLDVAAVAAVPIPWQGRAIGVLTVSSKKRNAFTDAHVDALESLASAAAKFLRRAQLARATHADGDADAYLFSLLHGVGYRKTIIHSGLQVSLRVRSAGTLRWRVVPSVTLGGGTISPVSRGGSALARGGA